VTSFDMSETIAPKSDQLDAVDLLGGDRTFTIERISRNNDEQPFNFHLAEFPRPWRPNLSMRRVLMACWGKDAATYVGRRVTLYCDPDVEFGGAAVGGTRIRALSHIDKPKQVPLLVKRGKSKVYVVQPLKDAPAPAAKPTVPTADELIADAEKASSNDDLNRIARIAAANLGPSELAAVKDVVTARRAELKDKPADEWPEAAQIPGA
jgi:hypothetical protein